MLRTDLFKSTAFRLAIFFSSLFIITFFVAGLLAYQIILGDLKQRLDDTISETFNLISRSYLDGDLEDLIGTVQSYTAASPGQERIFFLADAQGKRLAGNVDKAQVNAAVSTVFGDAFGLDEGLRFRTRRGIVNGNLLVVGTSFAETDEVGNLALASFAWAGGLASLIAIAAGILLAGLVQKRMQAIAVTMARVGHGELSARIPVSKSGDDVDVLSRQINAALDRLAALVEGMRQVSVDIAHDLKTPLNRLSMIIEEALEKTERNQGNVVELVQAQQESAQINDTFEALLRIAQLESGARRSRFTKVVLDEVLAVLVEAYVEVAAESGQNLSLSTAPGSPAVVFGDRDLLTQLFANLIENAIRHGVGGSTIQLSISSSATQIAVTVADDGPGIPQDEREKVLQRLYRLEKSRTTPGSGLGLSLVKAIADLHHADLKLGANNPGLLVTLDFKPA
jgi:signal transduction histidine kinase